jgi:proteasome activator subunit 4
MDETRTAHFDRPLKEVRVGESPSRPWGISIPAKYTNADSSSSVGSVPTASPQFPLDTGRQVGDTPQNTGKCPFDHRAMADQAHGQHQATQAAPPPASPPAGTTARAPPAEPSPQGQVPEQNGETGGPRVIPQMVFNGPVFLGYPPDQLALLLQNSNLGATMR